MCMLIYTYLVYTHIVHDSVDSVSNWIVLVTVNKSTSVSMTGESQEVMFSQEKERERGKERWRPKRLPFARHSNRISVMDWQHSNSVPLYVWENSFNIFCAIYFDLRHFLPFLHINSAIIVSWQWFDPILWFYMKQLLSVVFVLHTNSFGDCLTKYKYVFVSMCATNKRKCAYPFHFSTSTH